MNPASLKDFARDEKLEEKLIAVLPQLWRSVYAYEKVGSTMDVARQLIHEGVPDRTLVWAVSQEQGRGRYGRTWESPIGGIYLSLIIKPQCNPDDIAQISLVTGLALAHALQPYLDASLSIRWPNDLLMGDKKLAGILIESKPKTVIIGIGINLLTPIEQLPDVATSLALLACNESSIKDPFLLTASLCRSFDAWYAVWIQKGFLPIRDALRPLMSLIGNLVHIQSGNEQFEGTAVDLDEEGRLVVRLDSGIQRAFSAGEVSLLR